MRSSIGARLAFTCAAVPLGLIVPIQMVGAQDRPPAVSGNARALAATVLPLEAITTVRIPKYDADFAGQVKSDARLAGLERLHPGITSAVAAAAHDEAVKAYGSAVEMLRSDAARLYASRFTDGELAMLTAFFSTPTGKAIIALSAETSGASASTVEMQRREKIVALLQNPTAQARADLESLMRSGLLSKVRAVNLEISALSTRRFDDVSTTLDAALPARIEATIASFTKKTQP